MLNEKRKTGEEEARTRSRKSSASPRLFYVMLSFRSPTEDVSSTLL
jgi:hypothetical protein